MAEAQRERLVPAVPVSVPHGTSTADVSAVPHGAGTPVVDHPLMPGELNLASDDLCKEAKFWLEGASRDLRDEASPIHLSLIHI